MLLVEAVAAALIGHWAALLAREIWTARSISRELRAASRADSVSGVMCRVVGDGSHEAVVIGALSPTIYVGAAYLACLDDDERRGVLLHEEHHRRTRAPLRAAALASWISLARPIRRVERALSERVADLEVKADAFAMAAGTSPAVLASALLKGRSPAATGTAYVNASDRRISALLGAARGEPHRAGALPLEWLPLGIISVTLAACHAGLALRLW